MIKTVQKINTVYPPNNFIEFERWIFENYKGCNTERVLLPITWTAYYVNNGYGQNKEAIKELQDYIDGLDKTKKYFTCVQYDDSILNDVSGLDLLRFEMSKNIGVSIPLIGQPHPYTFDGSKKYITNFIGNKTHPIRESAEKLKYSTDYYISFDPHNIERYCEVISQSLFTLCYRGYGLSSFRICEALQYGSIPVYISDEYIIPNGLNFEDFGILISHENASNIDEILQSVPIENIAEKQMKGKEIYENYYTYEGVLKNIIQYLENESPTS